MAPPLLRINSRNLSEYLMVQHDEGLDPAAADFYQPQFAGAPSFTEGQRWSADSYGNREMIFPLLLDTPDGTHSSLHQLVSAVESDLYPGATLEFASDSATDEATYFQIERGRLEVNYQYFLTSVAATTRAILRVWVRPFGTTGTARCLASVVGVGSSAILTLPATGILGDVPAAGRIQIQVGSVVASSGRVVAYGVHPNASYNAIIGPSQTYAQSQASSTITSGAGASGTLGAAYVNIPVSPTGASGWSFRGYLSPPEAHVGRHRILLVARSGLTGGVRISARDRFGAILGPTAIATQTDQAKWGLYDLGEIQVQGRASSQEPVATQYVELYAGGATTLSISASPALQINKMVFLPLDYSAGILRTPGAGGQSLLTVDAFTRFAAGEAVNLEFKPNADYGGAWTRAATSSTPSYYFGMDPLDSDGGVIMPVAVDSFFTFAATTGATARYALASGRPQDDVYGIVALKLKGAQASRGSFNPVTPSQTAAWQVFSKMNPAVSASSGYVSAKLALGPSPNVSIITYDGTTLRTRASAAINPTTIAGLTGGTTAHLLTISNVGGAATAVVATDPANPIKAVGGSWGEISQTGVFGLEMVAGYQGISTGYMVVDPLYVFTNGAGASDIGARETFRFESWPENRVYQGNASIYKADQVARHRGELPKFPPTGSPAASGPITVVALAGDPDNFVGNDGPDVSVTVVERFRFLR